MERPSPTVRVSRTQSRRNTRRITQECSRIAQKESNLHFLESRRGYLNLTAISSGPPWTECLRSIFRGRDMQNVLPRPRSPILILSAGIALFILIPGTSYNLRSLDRNKLSKITHAQRPPP